jgi:hypothetical protein
MIPSKRRKWKNCYDFLIVGSRLRVPVPITNKFLRGMTWPACSGTVQLKPLLDNSNKNRTGPVGFRGGTILLYILQIQWIFSTRIYHRKTTYSEPYNFDCGGYVGLPVLYSRTTVATLARGQIWDVIDTSAAEKIIIGCSCSSCVEDLIRRAKGCEALKRVLFWPSIHLIVAVYKRVTSLDSASSLPWALVF